MTRSADRSFKNNKLRFGSLDLYKQTRWGNGHNPINAYTSNYKCIYYPIPSTKPSDIKIFGCHDLHENERNAAQSASVIIHGKPGVIDALVDHYNATMSIDMYKQNAEHMVDMPMYLLSISGKEFLDGIILDQSCDRRFDLNREHVTQNTIKAIPAHKRAEFEEWYKYIVRTNSKHISGISERYRQQDMMYRLSFSLVGSDAGFGQVSEATNGFLLDLLKIYQNNKDHKFILPIFLPTGVAVYGRKVHYRYWDCMITLPGGKAKFTKINNKWVGESIIDACIRELYEELKLGVDRSRLRYLNYYGDNFLFELNLVMDDINTYLCCTT